MIDSVYKNAFKEVYEILQNTEDVLIKKVPQTFITFLEKNMNKDYITHIDKNIEIDKQKILPETEAILSLIYRNYWATDEEKLEFLNKEKKELNKIEKNKKEQYKDITEIFQKRKSIDNVILDNNLIVVQKENFIKKIFHKIVNIIKNKRS